MSVIVLAEFIVLVVLSADSDKNAPLYGDMNAIASFLSSATAISLDAKPCAASFP